MDPGDDFFPGVDSELTRRYLDSQGREIDIYIGYFETQRQGKSLINYRANPLREKSQEISTGLASPGPGMVIFSGPEIQKIRYAAVIWYHFPSGDFTGRYKTKMKTIEDSLLRRRNNGAVIIIASPARDEDTALRHKEGLLDFVKVIAPVLYGYLP